MSGLVSYHLLLNVPFDRVRSKSEEKNTEEQKTVGGSFKGEEEEFGWDMLKLRCL